MRLSTAVFVAAVCFCTAAHSETVVFKTKLDGASEVPPNQTKGVGEITTIWDSASKKLSWEGSYSGLSGPETMAHYHGPADPGANAPPVVTVDARTSPFSGSTTLTARQGADLMAGKWYFNIHTEQNKGGEIRGQIAR
jgi:hypothetical protein